MYERAVKTRLKGFEMASLFWFRRRYQQNLLVNVLLLLLSPLKILGAIPLKAPPFPPFPAIFTVIGLLGGSSRLFGFLAGG